MKDKIKRRLVFEHLMDSGDFVRIYLLKKPRLNNYDDIEVEISGEFGVTSFGIQDWETLILMKGFNKVLLEKYGTWTKLVDTLEKQGKIF